MFAIINHGGKQYWAEKGSKLKLEKVESEVGSVVELEVLSTGTDSKAVFGKDLKNNKIKATVLKHYRDDKVIVFKKKRREHYQKKQGHKQHISLVQIEEL